MLVVWLTVKLMRGKTVTWKSRSAMARRVEMENASLVKEKKRQLIKMTAEFCDEHLDEECKQLAEKLIVKLARKRNIPFLHGRMEIWAAAIIQLLATVNFLFNKESKVSPLTLCEYFGTSKSTVWQKAALIREILKIAYYDQEFSTNRMKQQNPFANMVMVNGYMVPLPDTCA